MPPQYFRLCFDPPRGERFTKGEFELWVETRFSDFRYAHGGYMILPWDRVENNPGTPCWNIIVPMETSVADGDETLIMFLANRGWAIDGVRVITLAKYDDGNEIFYPIVASNA